MAANTPAHRQQRDLIGFRADAAVRDSENAGALLAGLLEALDVARVVEAFDPGERGRIGADEEHFLQETGVLEALHDGLQAGRALRVPFPGDMPQVLVVVDQTGNAPHDAPPRAVPAVKET